MLPVDLVAQSRITPLHLLDVCPPPPATALLSVAHELKSRSDTEHSEMRSFTLLLLAAKKIQGAQVLCLFNGGTAGFCVSV